MSKPPKIDITKSVMSQIESGQVTMKPKAYFTAKKIVKIIGLAVIGLALLMAIFYAVVIIQNGVFKEYLEFGKQGASIFWTSLPWGAIGISILLTVAMGLGIYLVQQKKRLLPSMIGVVAAVVLVVAIVFKISPDPNTNALARAVVGVDGNPTKIAGTVEEKDGNKLKIKTSTGEIVVIEIDNKTLGDKSFNTGDEIIVLGSKQNGTLNADAIKTTKKAESKVAEVKQEQPTTTPPEVKPEEPKPEQKPTATAPIVTKPVPTPAPSTTPIDAISISLGAFSAPKTYYLSTSINYSSANAFKVLATVAPTVPTYGAHYQGSYFNLSTNPNTSGWFKNTTGPSATYNVRVCEYSDGGCIKYSNMLTVTFP